MSQNLITAEFTLEDQQAALEAIRQLQSLSFLIGLSNTDKRKLSKMGDKSRTFVDRALSVARQNPDILPSRFDLEEFERDVALYNALYPINTALSKLSELVDGTLMAVGSDAYTTALDVYAYAKITKGVTGLEDLRAALGDRFRGKSVQIPAEAEA
ncbi:MAG: hypothetical protein KZQ93_19860 [Candidatus Thiodiazotropha sp. (ex Monitilora ramsayi)]|nr:hypothetical protein [Candidatus Thiodiazotropha sp. (ex Monitilora ramsayi)]